jgi:hypothetical protein
VWIEPVELDVDLFEAPGKVNAKVAQPFFVEADFQMRAKVAQFLRDSLKDFVVAIHPEKPPVGCAVLEKEGESHHLAPALLQI